MKLRNMKTNHSTCLNPSSAVAGTAAGAMKLYNKTKPHINMQRHKATLLLVLLGAAAPLLLQAQTLETYTFTTNRMVPDGNAAGLHDVRTVNSTIGAMDAVKVRLKIDGEYNGDLYGYLRHIQGGVTNFCVRQATFHRIAGVPISRP